MVKKWLMGLKTLKEYKDTSLPEVLVNELVHLLSLRDDT